METIRGKRRPTRLGRPIKPGVCTWAKRCPDHPFKKEFTRGDGTHEILGRRAGQLIIGPAQP